MRRHWIDLIQTIVPDGEYEQINKHNTHERALNMGVTTAGSAALTRTFTDILAAGPVWDKESGKESISVSLSHTHKRTILVCVSAKTAILNETFGLIFFLTARKWKSCLP